MASIRAEHSIESGKRQFFAELGRMLAFLRSTERDGGERSAKTNVLPAA
jgi:hypothetical protein